MALNTFSPNTKIESSKVNANVTNFSDHGRNVSHKWFFAGVLQTQNSKDYLVLNDSVTWSKVELVAETVPTGAAIIVDLDYSDDNGATWTTVFTTQGNRPQIAATERAGNTTTIDVDTGDAGRKWRAVIDQVGSTIAGANLTVLIHGKYDVD